MFRLKIFLIVTDILFILLPLGGCDRLNLRRTDPPATKEVQLTEEGGACGSGVGLDAGDTLVLLLEGNPSTGYAWEVGFYVPQIIQPAGEPDFQPDSDMLGSGGKYTFRFLAVGQGEVNLRMVYRRPGEKDIPELNTCEVAVTVK